MKNSFSSLLSAVSCVLCLMLMSMSSASAQGGAIDPELAATYFEEARALSAADGGRLWGKPLYGPMLFAAADTREVVANQADAEGNLQPSGKIFKGKLPANIGIANTAVRWAGVEWTMVMWPLPRDRQDRARLMAHELYHRIQDDIGLPGINPANLHLDTRDGRIWLQMEWRALERALWETGPGRRKALADALAFRRYRRSLFKSAELEENQLEINEGLSEYTGVKLSSYSTREALFIATYIVRQGRSRSSFVRSFAYISGPAYGVLLDEIDPGWRKKLSPTSDLAQLLTNRLALRNIPSTQPDVLARASGYDGQALIADETRKDELRKAQLATHRKRFVDGPVLLLPLSDDVGYTYDPNNVMALDDLGTVYPRLRVTDNWGILEVSNGALMIRENGAVKFVRVPAPANKDARPLEGDGWKLELKSDWQLVPGTRAGDFVLKKKE
jgi:hypothetical protein